MRDVDVAGASPARNGRCGRTSVAGKRRDVKREEGTDYFRANGEGGSGGGHLEGLTGGNSGGNDDDGMGALARGRAWRGLRGRAGAGGGCLPRRCALAGACAASQRSARPACGRSSGRACRRSAGRLERGSARAPAGRAARPAAPGRRGRPGAAAAAAAGTAGAARGTAAPAAALPALRQRRGAHASYAMRAMRAHVRLLRGMPHNGPQP